MSSKKDASIEVIEGLEVLSPSACDRLLESGGIGILAIPGAGAPVLRPVNYARRGESLVIRTGEGQIFEAAKRGEAASFVVSAVDRFEHSGWSVVVVGRLSERAELGPESPRPWARARKERVVALSIEETSGRRLSDGPMEDD